MKYKKPMTAFAITLLFLTMAGAFVWVNDYTWTDDFETGFINASIWTNYTATGGSGTPLAYVNESNGYLTVFAEADGTGTISSAVAVVRTIYDLNDNRNHRFDFQANASIGGEVWLDISNGTTLDQDTGSVINADGLSLIQWNSDFAIQNYTLILYTSDGNATLYNSSDDAIGSIIADDPLRYFQFRTNGRSTGLETSRLNVFDVTTSAFSPSELLFPANGSGVPSTEILFNATISKDGFNPPSEYNVINSTAYVWHSNTTLYNRTTDYGYTEFDGTNDYLVNFTFMDDWANKTNGSISMWFFDKDTSQRYLMSKENTGTTDRIYMVTNIVAGEVAFRFEGNNGGLITTSGAYTANDWNHVAGVWNSSTCLIYINGQFADGAACPTNLDSGTSADFFIGRRAGVPSGDYQGSIDEVRVYNVSLSPAQVATLYNQGRVETLGTVTGGLMMYNPLSGNLLDKSGEGINLNRENASLVVDGLWNISGFSLGEYEWNARSCAELGSDVICGFNPLNNTFTVGANSTGSYYETSTFETAQEVFQENITIPGGASISAARLIWNNTAYAGAASLISGNDYSLTRTLDVPIIGDANVDFYWQVNFAGGFQHNLTTNSQIVNDTTFVRCNATVDVPFINFTFKNETTSQEDVTASVSASTFVYWLGSGLVNKTLTFSNSTENPSYAFCFDPAAETLNVDYTMTYTNSESQSRTFNPNPVTLTNTTTNQTLFLLPTGLGSLVTFQVINSAEQPLEGVNVTVSRSGFGTVEQKFTDAAGIATFFLNPTITYTFTFDRAGYEQFVTTFAPTQTAYTINLGGEVTQPNDYTQGITYNIEPKLTTLVNNTNYEFNFTIASSFWTIDNYGFILYNSTGANLGSVSDTGTGTVELTINTGNHSTIIMNAFWDVNGNFTNVTRTWSVRPEGDRQFSITNFFSDLSAYLDEGIFGLDSFGLSLIIFMAVFIAVGVLSFSFGLRSPATIGMFIFGLILFLDVGVGILPNPTGARYNFITIITAVISMALIAREVVR